MRGGKWIAESEMMDGEDGGDGGVEGEDYLDSQLRIRMGCKVLQWPGYEDMRI